MARRRRIKAAKITHISLVPRGANRMPVIFKADDQTLDLEMLVKADLEKGELTAIVYAPESRDTQGDIASSDVIKTMMYDAARDGLQIDVRHDGVAVNKTQAFVAESFLVQKSDPRFEGIKDYQGNTVDPVGSWGVVLKVDDPVLRQKYRDGEWNGVSMGGTAVVETEKSDDMLDEVCGALAKALGVRTDDNTNGDIDMELKEMTEALTKSNVTLAEAIVKGVVAGVKELLPEAKKAEDTEAIAKAAAEKKAAEKKKAPVFKGNPMNIEDLQAHQRKIAVHTIGKDTDWADPDSVAEYMEKLADFQEEFGEFTEAELKSFTKGSASRRAGTNVHVASSKSEDSNSAYEGVGVTKEDQDCAKVGAEMAAWCNRERGFEPAVAAKA